MTSKDGNSTMLRSTEMPIRGMKEEKYSTTYSTNVWRITSYAVLSLVIIFTCKYLYQKLRFLLFPAGSRKRARKVQRKPPNYRKEKAAQVEQESKPMISSSETDQDKGSGIELNSETKNSVPPQTWGPIPGRSSAKTKRPFELKLNKVATTTSKRFEMMWQDYNQTHQWVQHVDRLPDLNKLIAALEQVGVLCMASGAVQMQQKGFFFANQTDTQIFVLCEIVLNTVTKQISVTQRAPKGSNPRIGQAVHDLVQEKIAQFIKFHPNN